MTAFTDFLPFLPGFIAAYSILFVAASSPGPAVAMLLGVSMGQGRRPALITTAGIATGSVVLNLATMAGIGLVLVNAAWAMGVIRLIGAGYLLWLAYGSFRKSVSGVQIKAANVPQLPAWRLYMMGFLLQVTNPKAIVFWLAISSIGATHGGGMGLVILFVTGAFAISFLCHGAWAMLLSSKPFRDIYSKARSWIEVGLGTFFVYAAYRLATDHGKT